LIGVSLPPGIGASNRASARGRLVFAPGYYSVLFEDPDGIRVEVNHVRARGTSAGRTTAGRRGGTREDGIREGIVGRRDTTAS
jgi:hypothetical protein